MDSSAVIRTWLLLAHFLFERSFGLPYKIRIGAIFTGMYRAVKSDLSKISELRVQQMGY